MAPVHAELQKKQHLEKALVQTLRPQTSVHISPQERRGRPCPSQLGMPPRDTAIWHDREELPQGSLGHLVHSPACRQHCPYLPLVFQTL